MSAFRPVSSVSARRAAIVLVALAVAVLHLGLGTWFWRQRLALPPPETMPPVQVDLIAPQPVAPPAPPAPAAPKPPVRAHRPLPTPHPAAPAPAAAPPLLATDNAEAPKQAVGQGDAGTGAAGAPIGDTGTGNAPSAPPADAASFAPPPSADMEYDLFMNGVRNETSIIHWHNDGSRYSLRVEMPIIFLGTFSYTSEGRVDATGLAPERYTEQRGRRATYVTTFSHDAPPQIRFSRSPTVLPLPAGGAQDRFSVMLQLASLVRGDPQRYTRPGATREFYVADTDSGETWALQYVDSTVMQIDGRYDTAYHFTRLARRADDRRKIDIWLAPAADWMPVRILQTEPNGTQFELLYRRRVGS